MIKLIQNGLVGGLGGSIYVRGGKRIQKKVVAKVIVDYIYIYILLRWLEII